VKRVEKLAKEWAERNSSPGIGGRDDTYEILITVQAQGFEAGYRQACKDAASEVAKWTVHELSTIKAGTGVASLPAEQLLLAMIDVEEEDWPMSEALWNERKQAQAGLASAEERE
jgi:hypothetical protein